MISFYFLASYVVSHISQAVSSEGHEMKQNDATIKDISGQKHTVFNESVINSAFLRISSDWPYYWIYFTNWSWTLICLSFWIDTCFVIHRYRKGKKHLHHAAGESKITSSLEGIYLNPIQSKGFLIIQ